MWRLSSFRIRIALLAIIAFTASAASVRQSHAQTTATPAAAKSGAVSRIPVRRPASSPSATPTPPAPKSLPQRIFDTPWVLFPTRFTVVIVLLAVSALVLMSGCWGTVRFAHLLRHLHWKEPPRRLKRGEVGAAGANVGFEFEERLNTKRAEDEERDRQIAWLRTTVLRLTEDHNRTAAALAMITEPSDTDGEADDLG